MKISIDLIAARKVTAMVLKDPFISLYEVSKSIDTSPKVVREYLQSFNITLKEKPVPTPKEKEIKISKYHELVVDISTWKLNEVKEFDKANYKLSRVQSVLLQRITSYNKLNGTELKIRTRTSANKLTAKRIK